MTYDELKRQEAALLSSSNKRLRLYGQAYKEIMRRYNQYAKSWLSDEQLISALASGYIKKQAEDSQFADDKSSYKARISAALKLIVNDKMTYENVYRMVEDLNLSLDDLTFENVRDIMSRKYYYSLVTPENLRRAVQTQRDLLLASKS